MLREQGPNNSLSVFNIVPSSMVVCKDSSFVLPSRGSRPPLALCLWERMVVARRHPARTPPLTNERGVTRTARVTRACLTCSTRNLWFVSVFLTRRCVAAKNSEFRVFDWNCH
jgi:hypothetical protein